MRRGPLRSVSGIVGIGYKLGRQADADAGCRVDNDPPAELVLVILGGGNEPGPLLRRQYAGHFRFVAFLEVANGPFQRILVFCGGKVARPRERRLNFQPVGRRKGHGLRLSSIWGRELRLYGSGLRGGRFLLRRSRGWTCLRLGLLGFSRLLHRYRLARRVVFFCDELWLGWIGIAGASVLRGRHRRAGHEREPNNQGTTTHPVNATLTMFFCHLSQKTKPGKTAGLWMNVALA